MKLDFEFACDHLNSTNHSLLLELSSSASCQHFLTMCIRSCTYMDTFPLILSQSSSVPIHLRNLELLMAEIFSNKIPSKPGFHEGHFQECITRGKGNEYYENPVT